MQEGAVPAICGDDVVSGEDAQQFC